jgi:hypothetical protein
VRQIVDVAKKPADRRAKHLQDAERRVVHQGAFGSAGVKSSALL